MLSPDSLAKFATSDALIVALNGTPIQLDRLLLRPPTLEDLEPMFEGWATDPEVTRYLIWSPHRSRGETRRFLRSAIDRWSTGPEYCWMICLPASGHPIGSISLRDDGYKAAIGFALARHYWSSGYVSEAALAMIILTLSSGRIFRISGVCDVDNVASARVMQKIGMSPEGRLRSWLVHPLLGPRPRDCFSYSITSGDWSAAGANRSQLAGCAGKDVKRGC